MRKLLGIIFFYILLAVLLLPMAATLIFGGFGAELPRQAHFVSVE